MKQKPKTDRQGAKMRSIETALKALEKRARKCKDITQGDYCKKHLPPPRIEFPDGTIQGGTNQTYCHICGKPYPPEAPRVIISFNDSEKQQKPETENPEKNT